MVQVKKKTPQQARLTSFFGAANGSPKKKKGLTQSKITLVPIKKTKALPQAKKNDDDDNRADDDKADKENGRRGANNVKKSKADAVVKTKDDKETTTKKMPEKKPVSTKRDPKKKSTAKIFEKESKKKDVSKSGKNDDDKINTERESSSPTRTTDINENDDDDDDVKIKKRTRSKKVTNKKRQIINDDDDDDDDDVKAPASSRPRRKGTTAKTGTKKRKNIIDDSDSSDDDDDDDENEKPLSSLSTPTKRQRRNNSRIKKQVVDDGDDDDDDDDESFMSPADGVSDDEEEFDNDFDEEEEEEDAEDDEGDESDSGGKNKSQRMINDVLKHSAKSKNKKKGPSKKTKTGTGGGSGAETATATMTDEELLKESVDSSSSGGDSKSSPWEWKKGCSVPYAALCHAFLQIEEVTGRLQIQDILTKLFRLIILRHPEDLYDIIYLASNSVAPAYECIELGIGDSLLIKAIGEASGTNNAMIKQRYEQEGDLGTVAQMAKGKQKTLSFGFKPKPLLAKEVLQMYRLIANTSGHHSQKLKIDKIKALLVRATNLEPKFLIRGLQGKLRIGLAQSTVLISLAHALTLTPPASVSASSDTPLSQNYITSEKAVEIIKQAYSEVPSYNLLVDAALSVPLPQFSTVCHLTPGIPITPMLAKPTKSIREVLSRLDGRRFTCEYKYDGERAQVHLLPDGNTTRVFSRNLLDTTAKFPEVPKYVLAAARAATQASSEKKASSFVLDTEVVAFNRQTNQFVPFQVLSTRKKEDAEDDVKVTVIVQAFDLMYLNGESLLERTLAERRQLLTEYFHPVPNQFQFATKIDHTEDGDTTLLEDFLSTAIKNQCEGLMVKTLDDNANYEPSRRSLNWLKLKKDYLDGCGDSFDLVPVGAYWGRGKRTGVYGAFLLACYDTEREEYQSVCKIGTGFSEEDLKRFTSELEEHVIPQKSPHYAVADVLAPDVWFDTAVVWEVKAADLSKSSTHKGAVDGSGRGIGLRFPRFERVRDDKSVEEATSSEQILEMFWAQDSMAVAGAETGFDEDEL